MTEHARPPQEVLTIGQDEFCGHLGNGLGICAPPVLAADMRVLLSRSYFTIPYTLQCGFAAAASLGLFVPPRHRYAGGYSGIGQTGDVNGQGTGQRDTLTGKDTSCATDGYPSRTRTLRVRALGIMPEGQPFIPANFALTGDNFVVSTGGSAAAVTEATMIPEPLSTQMGPAIVNSFMSNYRFQLGLNSEDTKWLFGPQAMSISGLGQHNGPVPANGEPLGGKMIRLPYAIDIPPQQSRKGINSASWEFVMDDSPSAFAGAVAIDPTQVAVGALAVCNAAAWALAGAFPGSLTWTATPNAITQNFKVFLFGESICVEDAALRAQIEAVMAETQCDEAAAKKLCERMNARRLTP